MRSLLFIVFLIIGKVVFSQCADCEVEFLANKNCVNGMAQVSASTSAEFIHWSIGDSVIAENELLTLVPTSSVLMAKVRSKEGNLFTNGDFEEGVSGFMTSYALTSLHDSVFDAASFNVGSDLSNVSFFSSNIVDHSTGMGNMLIVDGSNDAFDAFYRNSVNLEADQEYLFSFWATNVHKDFENVDTSSKSYFPAIFQVYFGANLVFEDSLGLTLGWRNFSFTYTPTSNEIVNVSMHNGRTSTTHNDFALDDIEFLPHHEMSHSFYVPPCEQPEPFVFSPDGDGNADSFFIKNEGMSKIYDLEGRLVKTLETPAYWIGDSDLGKDATPGLYVIVTNEDVFLQVTLIK